MKTLLTALLLICGMNLSAQIDTGDCRAKVTFIGYSAGKYKIEIFNKSSCFSAYYIRDPQGNFSFDTVHIEPFRSKVFEWAAPLSCGRISVIPDEKCKLGGFNCELNYVFSKEVCGVLPIPSSNFFPVQKGNTITGAIDLSVPPKDSDKYEVELLLENGTTIKKTVKLIHVSGDRYSFTTTVN